MFMNTPSMAVWAKTDSIRAHNTFLSQNLSSKFTIRL